MRRQVNAAIMAHRVVASNPGSSAWGCLPDATSSQRRWPLAEVVGALPVIGWQLLLTRYAHAQPIIQRNLRSGSSIRTFVIIKAQEDGDGNSSCRYWRYLGR